MSLAGSNPNQPQSKGPGARTRRSMILVCLLVTVAGLWVLGRILHRRLASQELLAYESSLAVYNPVWLASQRTVVEEKSLPSNTTFSDFLTREGFDSSLAGQLVRDVRPVYDLGHVRAGNMVKIARSSRGELRSLTYQIDPDRVLRVSGEGNGFEAAIRKVPYAISTEGVSGQVEDSLIQAVEDSGEHDELALRIADIFGWDMDFNTETQRGDTFEAVVEKKTLYGKFSDYGRILAAEYRNGNRTFQAVLYHDPEGRPAYYSPSGKSMKKAFLRSPLRFAARITSRFSYHRFHPILKRYRPHLGIDYGAPVGSAVQAVADGRVVLAGWHGESGKEVKIRHAMGYETYYLHLSQILVKVGQVVQQGQLIARTGATGLATGPHLDFRITQHGRFRNFLALNLPPAESVAKSDMGDFVAKRSKLLEQLSSLRSSSAGKTQQASLDGPEPGAGQGK
jgi:murein DD-endopeptidase MepM/ murein hydrolase activator NlpD